MSGSIIPFIPMCTYVNFTCVSLLKIKAYGLRTPHLFKYSTYKYTSCIDRKFEYMSRLTVHTYTLVFHKIFDMNFLYIAIYACTFCIYIASQQHT